METNEFDDIVRSGLNQDNLKHHATAMDQAKPFVWAEIQKQLNPTVIIMKWYYAAAVILFLLSGSALLYYFQNQYHHSEINRLQSQIDEISSAYSNQIATLQSKQEKLSQLNANSFEENKKDDSILIREVVKVETQIVYRVDTVFQPVNIYQSELIPIKTEPNADSIIIEESNDVFSEVQLKDESIFPSFKTSANSKSKENDLKFKLNSFAQ